MVSLLASIFIKNKDISEPKTRRLYGMLSSIVGILLNICLFVGKYFAGVISGSIAITADAINNLSDAGSSLITLIGFRLAGKKPDTDHPFGHGRVEYLAGLIVSVIILFMGFELAKTSVMKIISPVDIKADLIAMIILIVSILVKVYMYIYNISISKKIDSAAIKATAMDSLSDTLATFVALVSVIVSFYSDINIDGYAGIVVAVFIFFAGYRSALETISPLLGQAASSEFVGQIESIVRSYEEIVGIHDLIVHDYGPGRVFVSLHGEVCGDGDIYVLHDVIDRIEIELKEKLGCEAVIHMDPVDTNDENVARLREQVVTLVKGIDGELSIHDFRMVNGPTHTNIIFDVLAPFSVQSSDDEIKQKVIMAIKEKWDTYCPVINIDREYVKK